MMHTPISSAEGEADRDLIQSVEAAMEDWAKLMDLRHTLQFKPPRRSELLGQARAFKDDLEQSLKAFADRGGVTVATLEKLCQAELDRQRRCAQGHCAEQRVIAIELSRGEKLAEALEVARQKLVGVERQRNALQSQIGHLTRELQAYNASRLS